MGEKKRRAAADTGSGRTGARAEADRGRRVGRRRQGAPRLTWGTILWFLGTCLMLDLILWAVFRFGLARCYGVLCLIG